MQKIEITTVRLAEGTNARIAKLLRGGEVFSVFVRHAVEAEVAKRERKNEASLRQLEQRRA